jgi:hypothetical protein
MSKPDPRSAKCNLLNEFYFWCTYYSLHPVLQISDQINLIANLLLVSINSLVRSLVSLLINLFAGALDSLGGDINARISTFTSACSPY